MPKTKILRQKSGKDSAKESQENFKTYLYSLMQEPDKSRTPSLSKGEAQISSLEEMVLKDCEKNIKIRSSEIKEEASPQIDAENDHSKVFPFQSNPHIR